MPSKSVMCAEAKLLAMLSGLALTCSSVVALADEETITADSPVSTTIVERAVGDGGQSTVVQTAAIESPSANAAQSSADASQSLSSLLRQKLAERDRLQREIADLRTATNTPEQILVRVKMMEVNRTKLRQAGVDLKVVGESSKPVDLIPVICGEQPFGIMSLENAALTGVFEQLEKQGFAKSIASPSVVVVCGVPASLNVGGEIPVPPFEQNGAVTSKEIGTRLDVTATTLGNNKVRLEVRPRVAEVDDNHSIMINGQRIPAISLREIDTACELKFGESFLISGLVQKRTISIKSYLGLRKSEETEDIGLVVVATPELVR